MITIKLMPDYHYWPLWWYEGTDEVGNINPKDLDLSSETLTLLEKWAEKFDSFINMEEPNVPVPISNDELELFEKDGIKIWKKLIEELQNRYKVVYFSQKYRKVIENFDDY